MNIRKTPKNCVFCLGTILIRLCIVFRDQNEVDVRAVYHQLMDTYVTTDSDNENEAGPSTSKAAGARRYGCLHKCDNNSSSNFYQ